MPYTHSFLAALLAGCGLLALSSAASAAETDADFSKYCRGAFPNSAYQQRAQVWGVEHYCMQGGTLQGIDFAEACEVTTGSRSHRVSGSRVLCDGEPKDTSDGAGTILDLVKFCPAQFPNSRYEKRFESTGPVHYCRIPGASGGFVLMNIDLAGACRAAAGKSEYRETPAGVVCKGPDVDDVKEGARVTARPGPVVRNPNPNAPVSQDGSGPAPDETEDTPQTADDKPDDRSAGKLSGLWTMTAGVLPGMTVRVSDTGGAVKMTIVKLPGNTARTARVKYGLSRGDAIATGALTGGTLKLRTRLSVVGSEAEVKQACGNRVDRTRWNTEKWFPVFNLTLGENRIGGQHRGTEMLYLAGGCIVNHAPFGPLPAQAAQFLAKYGGKRTARFKLNPAHLHGEAVAFTFTRAK